MHICPSSHAGHMMGLFCAVVKTTVLLANMNDFTSVNDVYKQCECPAFPDPLLDVPGAMQTWPLGVSRTQRVI